ncbi:MAG: GNAT family N-acetyltransferase, partial [Haloarculaceae archaeon]
MSAEDPAATDIAWDHSRCTGTAGCPPRCPRFVDRLGTPLVVRPFGQSDYGALLEFDDEYPSRHRSMSLPPLPTPVIESWLDRLVERGYHLIATHGGGLVGHVAYSPRTEPAAELVVFVDE